MKICKECGGIAEWNSYYGGVTCTRCGYVEKPKPTHYDLLISRSPEELANILTTINFSVKHCHEEWLKWLKATVEEEGL